MRHDSRLVSPRKYVDLGDPRNDTGGPTLVRAHREGRRMLLTITTTHQPASDLGYLLHKHPDRCQSFDLSFGKAHVFYAEAGAERCSACLLLAAARQVPQTIVFPFGQKAIDHPNA